MSGEVHDVVVVGAGPTGLCLAAGLARLGVDALLLERRELAEAGSRAIGVHPPVLAALAPSGAAERLLAGAARIPRGIARSGGRTIGEVRFDRLGGAFPFVAAVPQAVTEAAVGAGGPEPTRGTEVLRILDEPGRAILHARIGAEEVELRARTVVVSAGAAGRGLVLPRFGVRARDYADRYLMADLADAPGAPADTAIVTLDEAGVLESFPLPGGGRRLVAWDGGGPETETAHTSEHRADRLRRAVAERSGEAGLAARVESATAFGIRRALLRRLRAGRVLAIGDAAHEVSPIGGQGMNLGLLDAVTLAPLLARWLRRREGDPEPDRELERWERRRLASARTAARLAGLNTALGRARSPSARAALGAAIGTVAAGPVTRIAARAYAMGFDRDAPRGRTVL
ncbi:FAD-dependent oxidoreductase [Leucobacter sp.]